MSIKLFYKKFPLGFSFNFSVFIGKEKRTQGDQKKLNSYNWQECFCWPSDNPPLLRHTLFCGKVFFQAFSSTLTKKVRTQNGLLSDILFPAFYTTPSPLCKGKALPSHWACGKALVRARSLCYALSKAQTLPFGRDARPYPRNSESALLSKYFPSKKF